MDRTTSNNIPGEADKKEAERPGMMKRISSSVSFKIKRRDVSIVRFALLLTLAIGVALLRRRLAVLRRRWLAEDDGLLTSLSPWRAAAPVVTRHL